MLHQIRLLFVILASSCCFYLHGLSLLSAPEGFHIELVNPEYGEEGVFTSSGGVIWSDRFRLQARSIKHYQRDNHSWIEAHGDLMLFYNGHLLIGDRLIYNLHTKEGTLYKGSLGLDGWYITSDQVHLYSNHGISLEDAFLSTDPSQGNHWSIRASKVFVQPNKIVQLSHVSFRLFNFPVLYFPSWRATPEGLFNRPIEYNLAWKGQRRRKLGIRYRFYKSKHAEFWTRLDYHIGRGPGVGLDAHLRNEMGFFHSSNFVARDTTISDPMSKLRYRIKGHYHSDINSTATFDIYYDRYGDNDTPSDYSFSSFDREQAGQTKAVLRDARPSLIHQISQRVKINPFQTVKKELPSYYVTPHPLYGPRQLPWMSSFVFSSHWRAEYLSYDFQDRLPINNYHSMRLFSQGSLSRPLSISGFHITPSAGWKLIGYNQSPIASSSSTGVIAPTGQLHVQTQWYNKSGPNAHIITAYGTLQATGHPRSNINQHYIFDYRDAVVQSTQWVQGLRQEWYDPLGQKASLELKWTHLLHHLAIGQPSQYYTIEGRCLIFPKWRLAGSYELANGGSQAPFSFCFRTENTWSPKFASIIEYRHRNRFAWRKNNHEDYNLETVRSKNELVNSSLSDPHHTILTHCNYQMSPNWVLRFDTAHGWARGLSHTHKGMKVPCYQQYCLGIGTDLGSNWRAQFQITKSPQDWDWRIRIDLNDGPVAAPLPRF